MMIELLGDNYRRCQLLQSNIELALRNHAESLRLQHVGDPARLAGGGLLALPAIAIDDEIMAAGRMLTVREILDLTES